MPNPITPEMRVALRTLVTDAMHWGNASHDVGDTVAATLPLLQQLLERLDPPVKESLTAEATPDAADHSEDARAMVGEPVAWQVRTMHLSGERFRESDWRECTRAEYERGAVTGDILLPNGILWAAEFRALCQATASAAR